MARRSVPTADLIAKEQQALDLKRAGVPYEVIASEVGYANRSGAYKAVQRALVRTMQEPADELRTIEADRLERMHAALWVKCLKGDLGAIDRALRIMDRRSKLLGLDVPPATGGRAAGDLDREIEELAAELDKGTPRPAGHPG